jgi:ribose transport system permease protein
MTGGIDLSIGSTIGLCGTLLGYLLTVKGWSVGPAVLTVIAVSILIGLAHGLLITRMRLQPFVVTLCGLMLYRGLARFITQDQTVGFGNGFSALRGLVNGQVFFLPKPFFLMLLIGTAAAVLLNHTVFGRHLLALGRNEQATRFSGVNTQRIILLTYVICSFMGGLAGMLFALNVNSVQPQSMGDFYELYAIAAAVLGGCSLRGGEGSILGVIIGTAVIRVLYNAIDILGIPTLLEFAIIGLVILGGVITDELIKRYVARRRALRNAEG